MVALPPAMDWTAYEAFRRDVARWHGTACDIARSHGLPAGDLHAFATGSNLVAAIDDHHVLKLYPPMLHHQYVVERAALAVVAGRLRVPTPSIVADGERDGWPYLVITRLAGVPGEAVWPALDPAARAGVLAAIGAVIAEVQALDPEPLIALGPRWDDFVPRQLAGCRDRLARLGLPARYLAGLDAYLAGAPRVVPTGAAARSVILTGEYIPENFLLAERGGRWELAGLIDFGDVMTGAGDYDLLGPCLFMAGGDRALLASLFAGYGVAPAAIGPALARRLMTLFLLHRFADPLRQIRIEGWQDRAADLAALERLIFPL
jgi:hygromycin-B 7''-O-kinase